MTVVISSNPQVTVVSDTNPNSAVPVPTDAPVTGPVDTISYFTGLGTALTSFGSFARQLLSCTSVAAVLSLLNLSNTGVPTGTTVYFNRSRAPAGYLVEDGTTYPVGAYPALFAALVKSAVVTISVASPAVVSWTNNQFMANDPVKFTSTGVLPTGITQGTIYYVVAAGNTFSISATPGGTAINTSGTPSGIHTAIDAPWGCANDLTTFNVPNTLGEFIRAWDGGRGIDTNRVFGSDELDAFQGHNLGVSATGATSTGNTLWKGNANGGGVGSGGASPVQFGEAPVVVSGTASGPVADGTNGTPRVAAETRPRNVTKLPCIKT